MWRRYKVAVRIFADALLINVALLIAFTLHIFRYMVLDEFYPSINYHDVFWNSVLSYQYSALPLTLLSLAMGALSGFYTYGRTYRGRYKVLIVVQAVSVAYGCFTVASVFLYGALPLPRSVLLLSWLLSIGMLVMARLWSLLWTRTVMAEHHMLEAGDGRTRPRVLVIGGAGYIGSALLPKLLEAGYYVRLLDMLWYSTDPIQDVLYHPHLEIQQSDFRHVDQVVEAMRDVDTVIHLGAIVGDPACALDEELTIEINLMATRMIAEVAKGSDVKRFIFASTCSVYGENDACILDECSAPKPVSLYARSKIASERILQTMGSVNFSPLILRFGTIYGLSGRTRFDLVINLLTAKAALEGQITIFGGDQWRPFLHVDDAALAIMKVLHAPLSMVHNQVFNVGSDAQNYTINQIGEIIHQIIPSAQLLNLGTDGDRRNYRVSFMKIQRDLHFFPQWTVEQGIRQVLQAIESGQITDYCDVQYSNVKFLSAGGVNHLIQHQNGWAKKLISEVSPEPRTISA